MTDDIQRAIGRLEGKVDLLLERSNRSDADREALTERIAKLENGADQQKAVVGVLGTVAGAVSAFASKYLGIS
jgi:hypothetical protein